MPGTGRAEVFFITAMMVLILVVCSFVVYFFVKTYKKEMRDRDEQRAKKQAAAEIEKTGE